MGGERCSSLVAHWVSNLRLEVRAWLGPVSPHPYPCLHLGVQLYTHHHFVHKHLHEPDMKLKHGHAYQVCCVNTTPITSESSHQRSTLCLRCAINVDHHHRCMMLPPMPPPSALVVFDVPKPTWLFQQ